MANFYKKYSFPFFVLLSIIAYFLLGYSIERTQFYQLFSVYTIAFIAYYFILKNKSLSDKKLFSIGILFRLILLFCLPFWSQDFYRFIWDGRLLLEGLSPYEYLPNTILNTVPIAEATELHTKMGDLSANHYSNYPPINQLFFYIAALLASKSIYFSALVLKLILIFGDIGIYHFGKKVLVNANQNPKKIFLYFLNPLVILELTGNLHFEGVMLCFFIIGLLLFQTQKLLLAAIFIALSIATKLLPLLILPFFYKKLGFKKSVLFYSSIITLNILLFLPFVTSNLIDNYSETIGLWFVNFEFNASFYYIFREIGFYIKGYNTIGIIGKITPIISILVILFYALYKKNNEIIKICTHSLLALTIYFLLSTTVHPWYIINVLVLALFTRFKFPIAWSYLIILSYFAYSQNPFKESYVLIFIEYTAVIFFFIYEIYNYKIRKKLA